MKASDYVIINNRAYDPITGLPIEGAFIEQHNASPIQADSSIQSLAQTSPRGVNMPQIHRTTQHSTTLSRRYVKKPTVISPLSEQEKSQPIVAAYSPMSLQQFTVEKAAPVHKFPSHAQTEAATVKQTDRPAEAHPITHRAVGRTLDINAPRRQRAVAQNKLDDRAARQTKPASLSADSAPKPAQVLKNEAIQEAMSREIASQKRGRTKKQKNSSRWAKFTTFATASLAVVMLAGYFTYLNMPNLSIKMAAVQSGVDARYPSYSPDGYAMNGPVSFRDGAVSIRFAYADGGKNFTLTQEKSNWDSSAVRQYVDSKSQLATTTQVDGLTIYTYEGNAAWVNGGILYTLEGDAPLSNDQIQRIATSL